VSDLPENWVLAPIGSLCTLFNGRAFKPSDWKDKGLPIVRIQNLNNPKASYNYFDKEVDDRFLLNGGELLFAWSGTPGTSFGAHVWHGGKAVLNQHIFRVDFDETLIDKRFFRYAINQKLNELIGVAHGGVGLRHVTKGVFENTEIVVPPFNEQKRIAEKLDSLLTRVDSCERHLERVPQILKRFRQSVLAAAMEGTLSEEWRLANNLEESSWQDTTLDEICVEDRVITYGVIKLGDDIPDGVPCLRTSNVRWLSIDEDGMKRIKPELSESYSRTILQGNEVLVNVRGTLGGVSVVKPYMIGWNVSREVAIAPLNIEMALPKFIAIWIASNSSQNWLTRKQKGVAYTGINIEDLRQLPVKLPPLEEQAEIVRRVESLFAVAAKLEARYLSASERVARLTPSLLGKGFRGELVEQDERDESAEELVERVRKMKEDSQPQKAGPRKRKGSKK